MLDFVEGKVATGTFVILSVEVLATMLEFDFARSREVDSEDYLGRPWRFRLAVKWLS